MMRLLVRQLASPLAAPPYTVILFSKTNKKGVLSDAFGSIGLEFSIQSPPKAGYRLRIRRPLPPPLRPICEGPTSFPHPYNTPDSRKTQISFISVNFFLSGGSCSGRPSASCPSFGHCLRYAGDTGRTCRALCITYACAASWPRTSWLRHPGHPAKVWALRSPGRNRMFPRPRRTGARRVRKA